MWLLSKTKSDENENTKMMFLSFSIYNMLNYNVDEKVLFFPINF